MKVIYYGFHGCYMAAVGAAIHAGILKEEEVPSLAELNKLPYFGGNFARDYGNLFYIGLSEPFHEIYSMGCKHGCRIITTAQSHMKVLFSIEENLFYVNAGELDRMGVRLGDFFYRFDFSRKLGEFFYLRSIQRSYFDMVHKVREAKSQIAEAME